MSFANDLKAFLQGKTDATDQVFLDHAPQTARIPFIELVGGSGGDTYPHLTGSAGLIQTIWHVYSYSGSRGLTDQMDLQVRDALEAYSGAMGDSHVDSAILDYAPDSGTNTTGTKSYTPKYWTRSIYRITHSVPAITR